MSSRNESRRGLFAVRGTAVSNIVRCERVIRTAKGHPNIQSYGTLLGGHGRANKR